jgi:hypothetical protein
MKLRVGILVVVCVVAGACGGSGSSSSTSDQPTSSQAGADASGGDASADDPAGTYVGGSLMGYTGAAAQAFCGADTCPDPPTSITITCATASACDFTFTGGMSGSGEPGGVEGGQFSGEVDLTRTCSNGKSSAFKGGVNFTVDDSGHLSGQLLITSSQNGDPLCLVYPGSSLELNMTRS